MSDRSAKSVPTEENTKAVADPGRRQLLCRTVTGLAAVSTLLQDPVITRAAAATPPRAKRIIYLFQSGGPSQLDLFDPKPQLAKYRGQDLPESIRRGQRLTGMTANQASFPTAPSIFQFSRHGKSGAWLSELLPYTAKVADELCFIKSMQTEQINHDPAITFMTTGFQLAGRPSIGSWISYGLGSENSNLPAFISMVSVGTGNTNDQPLYERLWGSGFLPSKYQGVRLRGGREPVLYLADPPGMSQRSRRDFLDDLTKLNQFGFEEKGDPEIAARMAQYELAFKMQSAMPELADLTGEPERTFERYGPDSRRPGTFAANCLLARRLAERGVRFIQLFHRGWDQHRKCPSHLTNQCRDTDQASAALILDLKERGLLDETLVVWGGEFGRTVYSQGELTATDYGRDHHPRCWLVVGSSLE